MRKIILGILILLTVAAYSDNSLSSITGSGNTLLNNSVEAAFDNSDSTSLKFRVGESFGWINKSYSEKKLLKYIDLKGYIPQGVATYIEYKEDGYIRSSGTFANGMNQEFRLDLSDDRVFSDSIYIRFSGTNLDQLELSEIEIETVDLNSREEKKKFIIEESSISSSSYTGAQHLADGLIGTVWRVWNNELWDKSDWFVLQEVDKQYSFPKKSSNWESGYAKIKPEVKDVYTYTKFYIDSEATGLLDIKIDSDNKYGTLASYNLDEYRGRWITIPIKDYGDLNSLEFAVYSSEKVFGGIGEVELWGNGTPQLNKTQDIIVYTPESNEKDGTFFLDKLDFNDIYIIDTIIDSDIDIRSYIDNVELKEIFREEFNGFYRSRYYVTNREAALGDNFYSVKSNDSFNILSSQIYLSRSSIIDIERTSVTDNRLYSGKLDGDNLLEFSNGLARVEAARIYYKDNPPEGIYYDNGLDLVYFKNISVEGEFIYVSIDMDIDNLGINSPNGTTEVVVIGNDLEIVNPTIKLIYPANNSSFEVQHLGYEVIWGITDTPDLPINIEGYQVNQYGNYFWLPREIKLYGETGENSAVAVVTTEDGRSFNDKINFVLQSNTHEFTLDQLNGPYYTMENSFKVSGNYNPWTSKLFINGEHYDTGTSMDFSINILLDNGLNIIKVENSKLDESIVNEVHEIKVYKQVITPSLTITSPTNNSFTNRDTIYVTGFASARGLKSVEVNGIIASLQNGRFKSSLLEVNNDKNIIYVVATYDTGESITKEITLFKDQTAPELTDILPEPNSWFPTEYINITGRVVEDNGAVVFVNGIKAEISDENFVATIPIVEASNDIAVSTKDFAGNVNNYPIFNLNGDFTPPEDFIISSDTSDITNQTRVTLTFGTTDTLSGVSHYEVSVDGSKFIEQTSPVKTPFLTDGERVITIRAFDNVGNYKDSVKRLVIDTVPPDEVDNLRVVSGNGRAIIKWIDSERDVETAGYIVEHSENSFNVLRGDSNSFSQVINDLENGSYPEFKVKAVDRAGNISNGVTDSVLIGITIEELNREEGSMVEFEDTILVISPDALPDDISKIVVTEIVSEDLDSTLTNPRVSPIYDFSVIKDDSTHLPHASFEKKYLGFIEYDEAIVKEQLNGFPEQNLDVYFFDENWSRWVLVEDSLVDVENNRIMFQTNHFSSFTVQPTVFEDLSPQELSAPEFSPFSSKVSHSPLHVSPQGAASTSVTELYLPGKNGFDFELRRIYDTSTAKADASGINSYVSITLGDILNGGATTVDGKDVYDGAKAAQEIGSNLLESGATSASTQFWSNIADVFQDNGDYAYAMGQGWRLNLPYIRGSNSGVIIRTPSGSYHNILSMEVEEIDTNGLYRTVTFKNKESEDFTLKVVQSRFQISTGTLLSAASVIDGVGSKDLENALSSIGGAIPGWQLLTGELILKDGTRYTFDAMGRLLESTDPTGLNKITVEYDGLKLDYITDSMDRKIRFGYEDDGAFDNLRIPQINRIWLEDDPTVEVTYNYGNPDWSLADLNVIDPIKLPLLKSSKDIGNRDWTYDYDSRFLFSGHLGLKVNGPMLMATIITGGGADKVCTALGLDSVEFHTGASLNWVFPMESLEGPGLGYTDLDYKTEDTWYHDVQLDDYLFGFIPTAIRFDFGIDQRVVVKNLETKLSIDSDTTIKSINFDYSFIHTGNKQFYNSKFTRNDGKLKEVHNFSSISKDRSSFVDWSDYLASASTGIFSTSYYYDEKVPVNDSIVRYDAITGDIIDVVIKEYDSTTLRPKTIKRAIENDLYSLQTITYDNWGNENKIINEEYGYNGRYRKSVTYNLYNGTSDSATGDANWDSSMLKSLSLDASLPSRYNLLKASKTINYDNYNSTSVESESYFEYDPKGKLKNKWVSNGSLFSNTNYTHSYSEGLTGEITQIIKPSKQIIDFEYTFGYDYYTKKSISDFTTGGYENNIVEYSGFDTSTGNLLWSIDGRGYGTEYDYDALGRKTLIRYPGKDDLTDWDPLTESAPDFRNDNPVTTIEYDDINLIVTELKNNEIESKYQFDNLSRLISISKYDGVYTNSFEYDIHNNITKYTNANGDITEFDYNPIGEISKESYSEKNESDPTNTTTGVSKEKVISYNYSSNTRKVTDENGNSIIYTYDLSNNLIETTYLGSYGESLFTLHNYYDGLGNLVAAIDANENVTIYEYNNINKISKVTLPEADYYIDDKLVEGLSLDTLFTYDISGNKETEKIEYSTNKFETKYEYDGLDRLIKETRFYKNPGDETYKESITQYGYDESHNQNLIIDPNNRSWTKRYTPRNQIEEEEDPLNNITSYEYDIHNRLEMMTDPRESKYTGSEYFIGYIYNDMERLEKAILPKRNLLETQSPVIEFKYDNLGNVIQRIEPNDSRTVYEYSSRKKLLSETMEFEDESDVTTSYTTSYKYDNVGNKVESRTNGGVTTSFSYNNLNNLVKVTNDDSIVEYGYDYNGNKIWERNPNGFLSFYEYDSLNRVTLFSDNVENESEYFYDLLGNVSKAIDGNDSERFYVFNELNNLKHEINGLGYSKDYHYYPDGSLKKETDFNNIQAIYTLTDTNLVSNVAYTNLDTSVSQNLSYIYDEVGNVKKITDNGIVTKLNYKNGTYHSDPYNQIVSTETAGNGKVKYSYDYLNNITSTSYNSGLELAYSYNKLSQLKSIPGFIDNITYETNGLKDIVTYNNGTSVDYDFTTKLELASIKYMFNGNTFKDYTYTYDLAGNISKENENRFGYDGNGQLRTAMIIGGAGEEKYKIEEFFTGEALNDVVGENELGSVKLESTKYELDWGGKSLGIDLDYAYRVKEIILKRPDNSDHNFAKDKIAIYSSLYNREGMFEETHKYTLKENDEGDEIRIIFQDAIYGRYFKVHSHYNDLDKDGNPIYNPSKVSFKLNPDDPLEIYAVTGGRNEFYRYDGNGNRVAKTIMSTEFDTSRYEYYQDTDLLKTQRISEDEIIGYSYDKSGNLVAKGLSFTEYTDEDDNVQLLITPDEDSQYFEYSYDLKNRLTVVKKLIGTEVVTVASYTYDGFNQRIKKLDRDNKTTNYIFDLSGNVIEENTENKKTNYIFVNGRLISKVVDGEKFFYGVNNVGSTTILTDMEGEVVWTGDITPFGDSEKSLENESVKYTGKTLDPDTGLYYFNARWYDPNLGRFITEDPIKDGNNWYIYCLNNPLKFIDPTGLEVDNGDGTFTIEKDDTLWDIAENRLGTGESWEYFQRVDGDDVDPTELQPGMIYAHEEYFKFNKVYTSSPKPEDPIKNFILMNGLDNIESEEYIYMQSMFEDAGIKDLVNVTYEPNRQDKKSYEGNLGYDFTPYISFVLEESILMEKGTLIDPAKTYTHTYNFYNNPANGSLYADLLKTRTQEAWVSLSEHVSMIGGDIPSYGSNRFKLSIPEDIVREISSNTDVIPKQ